MVFERDGIWMVPVTVVPDGVMRSDFGVLCELVEEFRVCVLHEDVEKNVLERVKVSSVVFDLWCKQRSV